MRKSKRIRQSISEAAPTATQDEVAHEQGLKPSASDPSSQSARESKKSPCPSVDEVRDRIAASHRHGPSCPLEHLVEAEVHLETHSAALARLAAEKKDRPDTDLLVHQLTRAVDTSSAPKVMAPQLKTGTVALFSALKSMDPIESILNRILVVTNNSVMRLYAKALYSGNPKMLDTYLRYATKGTRAIIDIVDTLERRRSPKAMVVEKFSVNAGGKAMVGNFEIRKESDRESPTGCDSESRMSSPPADNEETED